MHEKTMRMMAGANEMSAATLRRGPWTLEEDKLLMSYIHLHGEGRWNLLARSSGLKRTGKSCRLRWLNYLKPDIKRGNLSPEEQLVILELHGKWGNRWSRIAQHLPGRTDNEIKNYWRTRVQKQARQLRVDANSAVFRDLVRCYWIPRLLEKIHSSSTSSFKSVHDLHHPTAAATDSSTALLLPLQPQPQPLLAFDQPQQQQQLTTAQLPELCGDEGASVVIADDFGDHAMMESLIGGGDGGGDDGGLWSLVELYQVIKKAQ